MKKQLVLDLVVEFPKVEIRFPNAAVLQKFSAVIDDGKGCNYCALRKFDAICPYVNCDNVIYLPVFEKPCL